MYDYFSFAIIFIGDSMKKYLILTVAILLVFCTGCKLKNQKTKGEISVVSCEEKDNLIRNGALLLDVRSKEEFDENHLVGAINIEYTELESKFDDLGYAKEMKIIVYCASGKRSKIATETLKKMGYVNIYDLGSINNCK